MSGVSHFGQDREESVGGKCNLSVGYSCTDVWYFMSVDNALHMLQQDKI